MPVGSRAVQHLLLFSLLLAGCSAAELNQNLGPEYSEQLYIDARHEFAVKHPLDWQKVQFPVSDPDFLPDAVYWQIGDPKDSAQEQPQALLLIRCLPLDDNINLASRLNSNLTHQQDAALISREILTLPAGEALKQLEKTANRDVLSVIIRGSRQDFILTLNAPTMTSGRLMPIFMEILDSFIELESSKP